MLRGIVVVVVLWSSTARAQSAGERADALFRQGRELLAAGKIAEACSAFEQSQKVEPAVTTLLRLAGCREKLGQLATARQLFRDAERMTAAATTPADQQLHDTAKAHAQKLDPRVSMLTIHVPPQSQIEGLEIARGAERIAAAQWNRELPIDGGSYTITARAPGRDDWRTTARVPAEGGKISVEVPRLDERGGPAPLRFTTTRKIAIGAAGASVIAGVIGIALGSSAKGRETDAFELCPDPAMDCDDSARANALLASGRDRALGANIAFGVAAAAAIGAAVLWFTGSPTGPSGESPTRVSVTPSVARDGAGVVVMGRF